MQVHETQVRDACLQDGKCGEGKKRERWSWDGEYVDHETLLAGKMGNYCK